MSINDILQNFFWAKWGVDRNFFFIWINWTGNFFLRRLIKCSDKLSKGSHFHEIFFEKRKQMTKSIFCNNKKSHLFFSFLFFEKLKFVFEQIFFSRKIHKRKFLAEFIFQKNSIDKKFVKTINNKLFRWSFFPKNKIFESWSVFFLLKIFPDGQKKKKKSL